jgi:hypothetical protein
VTRLDWERANQRDRVRKHGSRPLEAWLKKPKKKPSNGYKMIPLTEPGECGSCHTIIRAGKHAWTRAAEVRCCQCGPYSTTRREPRPHVRRAESLSTENRPSETRPDTSRPGEALSAGLAALAEPGFAAPIIVGGQIHSYALIAYGNVVELLIPEELEDWGEFE